MGLRPRPQTLTERISIAARNIHVCRTLLRSSQRPPLFSRTGARDDRGANLGVWNGRGGHPIDLDPASAGLVQSQRLERSALPHSPAERTRRREESADAGFGKGRGVTRVPSSVSLYCAQKYPKYLATGRYVAGPVKAKSAAIKIHDHQSLSVGMPLLLSLR
jgi:hypothetical protein